MDNIVLSYHDCLVRERDLRTLDEGSWINDIILSFDFEYLRHSRLTEHDRLLLVEPSVTQLLKLSDPASANALLDSLGCQNADWIFLLVNDSDSRRSSGGCHWTLLVVSVTTGKSFHLDPLYSQSNFNASMQISHHIANYCDNPKLAEVVQLDVAKQRNACDCGIYCLVYAEQLCSDILNGKSDWQVTGLVSPEIHQCAARKRSELKHCICTLAQSKKMNQQHPNQIPH